MQQVWYMITLKTIYLEISYVYYIYTKMQLNTSQGYNKYINKNIVN